MMQLRIPLLVTLVLLGITISRSVIADYPIEVIELQSTLLEEVLPVVRPLAGEDGSVTGMGNHLVIMASPDRVREIRQLLQTLDRPPRRLLISVSNQGDAVRHSRGYDASADIKAGNARIGINSPGRAVDDSRARISVYDSGRRSERTAGQQVQALEGRPAYIGSGATLPLSSSERYYLNGVPYERHSTQLRNVSSGFYVIPRLQGETVLLEIRQQDDRPRRGGNGISTQHTATTVRGRLGEWLELGDISNSGDSRSGGLGRAGSTQGYSARQIRVKVECLDCPGTPPGR
ncbi:MAG: hypothetical protein PVJ15_01790 [Gammaproteobacteria bacterium]